MVCPCNRLLTTTATTTTTIATTTWLVIIALHHHHHPLVLIPQQRLSAWINCRRDCDDPILTRAHTNIWLGQSAHELTASETVIGKFWLDHIVTFDSRTYLKFWLAPIVTFDWASARHDPTAGKEIRRNPNIQLTYQYTYFHPSLRYPTLITCLAVCRSSIQALWSWNKSSHQNVQFLSL